MDVYEVVVKKFFIRVRIVNHLVLSLSHQHLLSRSRHLPKPSDLMLSAEHCFALCDICFLRLSEEYAHEHILHILSKFKSTSYCSVTTN